MFRIECFVEDKILPKALRALASAGAYEPKTYPMIETVAGKDGKVHSTAIEGLNKAASAIASGLNGHKQLTRKEAQGLLESAGVKRTMVTVGLRELVENRVIKRVKGRRGIYDVVGAAR